jgi:hypothetical protein
MQGHTTSDQIVEEYLDELRMALRSVNPTSGGEFVAEIEQHIAEGRATLDPSDEVGLRNLLERIGSPSALAAALQEMEPQPTVSGMDRATPWLILFGGFVFGFGWLVGLYGLWTSRTWRIWDKLLGTLVWPGGLLGTFYFFVASTSGETCHGISRLGQTASSLVCVHHGLIALPRALGFLVGFVMVAAPVVTSFRLSSVLTRGYEDASDPRGIRLMKTQGSSRTGNHMLWISVALVVMFFFILVVVA